MNPQDWAGLIVSIMTIATTFGLAVRWLVKHYLAELKTNGGGSMRDDVVKNTKRLERVEIKQDKQGERIDDIYHILFEQYKR